MIHEISDEMKAKIEEKTEYIESLMKTGEFDFMNKLTIEEHWKLCLLFMMLCMDDKPIKKTGN